MSKYILCPRCKLAYNVKDGKHQKRPLLLSCGHTFCESCVIQLAKERKTSIVCPICLAETSLPAEDGGVQSLKVDQYIIGQVMQSQRQILENEINKSTSVTMVHRKKQISGDTASYNLVTNSERDCKECGKKAATSFCAKCDCNMCTGCFQKVHSLSKTLQSHQPLPITEEGQLEVSQMCKEHETRPLEYFCEDDGTIICSRCVIVGSHKGHNISSIEDKNRLIVNEMEPNLQMANHVFRRLKRIDKEIATFIPDSKKEVGPVLEEVGCYFQYLHGVLQVREHQLQQEVLDAFNVGIEPIEKLRVDLQTEYRQLDLTIKAAHRIMNNNDEIIVNAKEILDKLIHSKEIPCIIEPSSDSPTTEKISFHPGMSIDSAILTHGEVTGSVSKSLGDDNNIHIHSTVGSKLHEKDKGKHIYKRFDMFTMRDRPEKFTEDKESLGTSTPTEIYSLNSVSLDGCSIASTTTSCSEDVIIEDIQDIILDDGASTKSEDIKPPSKSKPHQKRSNLTKTRTKNKVEDVIVTHIVNPRRFWVQLKRDSGKLSALSYSLQQWCCSPAANKHHVDGVDTDDIVLAQYSADKQWYRSRVKQVIPPKPGEPFEKTMVEVVYLDFGNHEVVPVKSLRNMQNRFMKHPEFAMECCLVDLLPRNRDGAWSVDAVQTFAKIVENKVLQMTVIKEENNILQVDLSKPPDADIMDDSPASVRDALVFLEFANLEAPYSLPKPKGAPAPNRNFIKPEMFEEGITYDVQVSFAGTPDCFYVQELGEEFEYLQKLTLELQNVYSSRMKDSWQILCPYVGMICVAQFTGDEMWYRARIIDIPGNREVKVHYVDYGNVENTSVFKIRKILDTFLVLPAQAVLCKLMDVQPHNVNEGWSDESLRWWSEMVTLHRFAMKIVSIDKNFHVVMRGWDWTQSDSVNLKMVMEGKARSVGKWSEPPNIEVESSLSTYVPRLSYQVGEGSFPEPSDIDAQPVYWKTRQQRPTRKYQETVLTPPNSPVNKSRLTEDSDSDIPAVVSVLKRSPGKEQKQQQSPNSRDKSTVKQSMDISPEGSPKEPDTAQNSTVSQTSQNKKSPKAKRGKKQKEDIEVIVSHYMDPSEFYLQIANAGRVGLNDLMREMDEAYRNSDVEMITFKQGNYCAVLSPSHGQWYRGKIQKVLQKNLMEVFMLDYGFTEIVTTSSIRNILRQFRKERAFSFCCHLADLIPAGGMNEWSKTAIELMKSEIQNKKLYLHKRGDVVNGSLPVDLVIEKYVEESALEPGRRTFVSLIELMKERGLAIRKTKKEIDKTRKSNCFPVHYYKKAEAAVKDGDSVMPVYVDFDAVIHCYTMEGDDDFQNMCDLLDQKFKNSEPHGSDQVWEKGQACAAFYDKDQQWHRASVLTVEPTKVQIHFIDYGNTEWVDYDQLRADIEEFIDIPQQTFLCMLHDIKPMKESGRWTVEVLEFMHRELVNKYCKITVIEKNGFENEYMTVNLELNGKDFGAVLVQYGMAKRGCYITDQQQQSAQIEQVLNEYNPYKKMPDIVVGGIVSVMVTHVELPNIVYLQNTHVNIVDDMTEAEKKHVSLNNDYLSKLEQLSIDLNKAAPQLPVIFSPKIGLPCCAQFGFDNCYYRAVIVDIYPDTDQLLVLYVDYGNSEIITTQKMRALPPKYLSLPGQSIRCRLMDIDKPVDAVGWTKTALLEMMQVLANKPLLAKIASQKPITVELFDPFDDKEDVLVYQSVVDSGHVRLALKPVTSPRSLEAGNHNHAVKVKPAQTDRESKMNNEDTKDNADGDDQSEASTITSTTRETTSKSWADMVEEGSSVDINELPDLEDIDPETDKAVEIESQSKVEKKKRTRKSRKVEAVQHDDECFD